MPFFLLPVLASTKNQYPQFYRKGDEICQTDFISYYQIFGVAAMTKPTKQQTKAEMVSRRPHEPLGSYPMEGSIPSSATKLSDAARPLWASGDFDTCSMEATEANAPPPDNGELGLYTGKEAINRPVMA